MGTPSLCRVILAALAGMILPPRPADGADAVFSKDGDKIYLVSRQAGEVEMVDLASGTLGGAAVPGLEQLRILDLARTRSGEIVCLTEAGLRSWDGTPGRSGDAAGGDEDAEPPATATGPDDWRSRITVETFTESPSCSVAIEHLGRRHRFGLFTDDPAVAAERAAAIHADILAEGWDAALERHDNDSGLEWPAWRICADPSSGRLFGVRSTTDHGPAPVGYWETSHQMFRPVEMGHTLEVRGLGFGPDGSCFFGAAGDLWHGAVRGEPSSIEMAAYRYAPLAALESSMGTSGALGVESVVVAGPWLYVHLERMGGSGWGQVVRLARPRSDRRPHALPTLSTTEGLQQRLADAAQALDSVEVLAVTGGRARLAASADGSLVYFQAENAERELVHRLVRGHGRPEPLELAGQVR